MGGPELENIAEIHTFAVLDMYFLVFWSLSRVYCIVVIRPILIKKKIALRENCNLSYWTVIQGVLKPCHVTQIYKLKCCCDSIKS